MSKSRADVLASLRNIFNNPAPEPAAEPAKTKPSAPSASSSFARFRREQAEAEVAAVEEEEEEEDEEEQSEDVVDDSNEGGEESSEEAAATDVAVSPVEDLLDRVESLIDFISENSEALKAWIAVVR